MALGTYRDKTRPTAVADTFTSLLAQMKSLPIYLPDLHSYLLEYPNAASNGIRSEFYWEKVNFGLKPTLRIVQAIVYRGTSPDKPAYAVAVKQLYASHYFETALDLTVCLSEKKNGFLSDHDQGFATGRSHRLQRGNCAKGCGGQDAVFATESACRVQAKT